MAVDIKQIEKKLWDSADSLRGNMSSEEYMHVILGVLSLKYISDRYNVGLDKLKKDGLTLDLLPSSDDFYYSYNSFIVKEKSSWNYVMKFSNTHQIGEKLDEAFIDLEKNNNMLKGLFNKNYNREGLDQTKLGEVVKIFSNEDFSAKENEDLIGRIYEYFLGNFFKDRGQNGGEFYTPTSIVKLMVNLLKPTKGTIYDPACGTGGILVQSKRYIEEHNGNVSNITVYGQEYNNVTWKLAKLNLVLNGFPLFDSDDNDVLGSRSADTFTDDQHKNKLFDYVMANPPFNMKKWSAEELINDPRWKWGLPPSGNANYAWLSHMLSKLNTRGKAAVVLANGSLSSSGKDELNIRKNFIKDNLVDAIVELPDKLFYTTGIPACIWIFNKNKVNRNVLMVSSGAIIGNMISKKLRELTHDDITKISSLYNDHLNNKDINVDGVAKTINIEDIEKNDYSFVPGRYVSIVEENIDKEKNKIEIKNAALDLKKLLKEFNELVPDVEKAIKKILEED